MCVAKVYLLLASVLVPALCFNHWVVTEDGKIEYQAASPFNLRQPFDLMAFMKQEERVTILKELKDELIEYKNEFELLKEFDSFDESFIASEPKCREVKFITSQDLSISTVLPLEHNGIRIEDHLDTFPSSIPGEPFCSLSPLPFSMYALEHLEGVQNRRSLVAPPEKSVLSAIGMRMEVFGSLVHHALSKNSTSWVLLDLATLYWRARGNLHHAVDCIRRSLHYSPTHSMDIALLNLANILHRSQHSTDAVVPLLVATSIAPQVNVLHYTLGNVYASLSQLNESVSSFQRCIDLDPSDDRSLTMYLGALCELKKEQASLERSRKLDTTQRKLDQFYENMEMLQRLQQPGSQSSVNPSSKRRGRVDQGGSELSATDAVPASLPINITTGVTQRSRNSSNASTTGEKIRSKSLKIVLIPNEEASFERATAKNQTFEAPKVPSVSVCLQRFYSTVLREWCSINFASRNSSEVCWVHGFPETRRTEKKRPSIRLKMKPLPEEEEEEQESLIEQVDNTFTSDKPSPPKRTDDYPRAYHSLEFFPYNPLPDQLEKVIFPHRSKPLADYDDPYWPTKMVCLQLVQEVRQNPQLANFPGTFLPPAARGADIKRMYSMVPEQLPSTMKQLPYCTDILELPYSMSSLDHLPIIADRRKLNESKQETALKRVIIDAVTGDREKRYSLEESAFRTYAAMLQVGPNWALFNIASLYWRVVGDATNAIECLRRALYHAPDSARDVGLIGMANVLHGLGALEEAVIAARAALDIKTESPVGHYTLASVYSTQGDYVAASLHLRAALHISVFEEAILSLKLIRCSLKFKEEQLFLRKKMQKKERQVLQEEQDKLIREMSDAVLHGKPLATRRNEPPLILEDIEPPEIPEMRVQELKPAEFTGENAIWYLTSISLMQKARLTKLSEKDRLALEEQMKQPQEVIKVGNEYSDSATKVRIPIKKIPVQKKPIPDSTPPNQQTKQEPPASAQSTKQKQKTPASKEEDTKTRPKVNLTTAEANTTNQTAPDKPSAKPDTKKLEVAKQADKAAENSKKKEQATQTSPPPQKRKGKTHEEIREEEIKKRFPGTRPWPTVDECLDQPPPRKLVFTSTWLSVTAKGAKIKEYINFKPPLEHYPLLPYCHNDFEQSRKTLSHLTGMSAHPLVQYKPEKGLQEVLCNMDGNRRSLEEMATRIKTSLAKFPDSWVVSNLAALYWRIVGQGQLAIKCLKHALYFSDDNARDVALVSLSNVLYRSGFDMDALAVIHMSLEASPTLVVTHFTMANILAAQGFYVDASGFYESTLHYQPQFQPAAERLRSVRCLILLSRKRVEDDKRKELESPGNT